MVHLVLDSAITLLTESGAEDFNTNRVAERAGVSIGTVYQYFSSKEMMLSAVVERGVRTAEVMIRETSLAADQDMESTLRLLVAGLLQMFESRGELLRNVFEVVPFLSGGSISAILENVVLEATTTYLHRNAHRYHVEGGTAAIYVGANSAVYVLLKWVIERPPSVSAQELIDAMIVQFLAPVREL